MSNPILPGEQARTALAEVSGMSVHYYAERDIKPINVQATVIDVTPDPRVNWDRVIAWCAVIGFVITVLLQ